MILTQRTENIDHITECKDEEFEKKYKFIVSKLASKILDSLLANIIKFTHGQWSIH